MKGKNEIMITLYEPAFAKINLTLEVLDKREDGFHNIKSVMQAISLYDYLTISLEKANELKLMLYIFLFNLLAKNLTLSVFPVPGGPCKKYISPFLKFKVLWGGFEPPLVTYFQSSALAV